MKNAFKLLLPIALFLTTLGWSPPADAQSQSLGELRLPAPRLAPTSLKVVGLPELWHEPPSSISVQLRAALPSPLERFDLRPLAILHQTWRARGVWPLPGEPTHLSLGLGGPLGAPQLHWLGLWTCPHLGVPLPKPGCQLKLVVALRR